jgi:hypothetical protein
MTVFPVMPAKAGIHDFTIQKQARATMMTSLRDRAAAAAIHLSFPAVRKDGLLRRCAPRNDGATGSKPMIPRVRKIGLPRLCALVCLFVLASTGVSAAVESGTYQLQGVLLVPRSISGYGYDAWLPIKGSISAAATITRMNFRLDISKNKDVQTITCSGTYQGSEKMAAIPFSCSDGIVGYAAETHEHCDPVSGTDGGSIFLEPQGFRGNFFLLGQPSCMHLVN